MLLLAGAAGGLGACSSMPDFTQVKLIDPTTFLPSNSQTYTEAPSARILRPVGAEDLVDAQGYCAGMAPPPPPDQMLESQGQAPPAPPLARGGPIGLEMSECEVVRALGPPQSAQLSTTPRGERNVVLIYRGDNSADYSFIGGRLVSLERGPEPPAPPKVAKKPPPKKPKKQPAA